MNSDKYNQYTVEEWIKDQSFRNFILYNDVSREQFWAELSAANDEVRQRIHEASEILLAMNELHSDHEAEGTKRAKRSLQQLEHRIQIRKNGTYRKILLMGSAAASIALIGFLIWLMWPSPQPVLYQTAADETEEVILPDGSIVYLNENSSLVTGLEWSSGNREVTLDGEAYFMVRSQMDSDGNKIKFTVNTGGLDIEVLGTQFNVHTRDTLTSVALDEGSIRLIKENGADQQQESYLIPGQVAFYNIVSKQISITEKALANKQTFWKPQVIEFNQITLKDALSKMETIFGIHFSINNNKLMNLKINKLSVPSDKPEVFIKTVNILFSGRIHIRLDPETNNYQIDQITPTNDK